MSTALYECKQPDSTLAKVSPQKPEADYTIKTFHYDSLTIHLFFNALINNHLNDFYTIDSAEFNQFCRTNNINNTDSSNIAAYFTIKILHELFTCQMAYDCSKGEILNIPYQWHWITPNPRYAIVFASNQTLLKDTPPPDEFSRYNSYADIDRTPYLFLSDLVSPELKYYSTSCDTFSTFGWCSEREMAFTALVNLLEFNGKVVAEGNHSWSELVIPMKLNTGNIQTFKVIVDNTFNGFNWSIITLNNIPNWEKDFGDSSLAGWYNRKANSTDELNKIRNHRVSSQAMSRIETKIVAYLEKKINEK